MLDEKILSVLRNNTDTHVSGEELCKLADISRAAIWKHIEKFREEGYEIEASPHLGYKLVSIPDRLIPGEIKWGLSTKIMGKAVISYKKIDSTNDAAYELAEKGLAEGSVVLAEEQVKGKGRHGRLWESPPKDGIYMSCILRPEFVPNEIPKITLLAAVAVAKAIREATGLNAMIKWPNDILVNERKVCGILTEMKAEQDAISFVVIGIGINVNNDPRRLPKGATSLKEELRRQRPGDLSRVELTKKVLEMIEKEYLRLKREGFQPIIEEWKEMSSMIGSRVKVVMQNRTFEGQAHDIDSDGAFVVRLESGVLEKVSSGDIVIVR